MGQPSAADGFGTYRNAYYYKKFYWGLFFFTSFKTFAITNSIIIVFEVNGRIPEIWIFHLKFVMIINYQKVQPKKNSSAALDIVSSVAKFPKICLTITSYNAASRLVLQLSF